MPYNPGTGIYTLPAIYLAIPGTTILATQHNTPLEDLEVANNYARPVIAGGTGQASKALARGTTGLATEGNIGLKGANIASAATLTLVDDTNYNHVTGVVTVTAISTRAAGQRVLLEFEGILILTHNATSLILPGGQNITTAANDVAEFVSEGAGNWRCVSYQVSAQSKRPPNQQTITATGTYTKTPGALWGEMEGVGGGGGSGGCAQNGGGTYGATGGGGSGFWGKSGLVDISAFVSGTVTIGAGGTAGAAAAGTGGTGGSTSITIGANTYTWPGGDGSPGYTAQVSNVTPFGGTAAVAGTNVVGTGPQGAYGIIKDGSAAAGGFGGSNPLGTGGNGTQTTGTGGAAGNVGQGFGSGGGGASVVGATSNRAGAAGRIGWWRITEYFN